MSPDSLIKLIRARPFVPFNLHTADGRTFEVPHPEFISVSPAGRTAHVFTNAHHGEDYEVLDVFLLISATTRDKDLATPPESGEAGQAA